MSANPRRFLFDRRLRIGLCVAIGLVAFGAGLLCFAWIYVGPDNKAQQAVYGLGGIVYTKDLLPSRLVYWLNDRDFYDTPTRVTEVWFCQVEYTSKRTAPVDLEYMIPLTSDIGDAELEVLVPYLLPLKRLEYLNLEGTRVTDEGVRRLAQLRNISRLDLSGTRITDAALKHIAGMQDLESLSLWITDISDDGLAALAAQRNLKSLNVDDTRVTAGGVARLQRLLPALRIHVSASLRTELEAATTTNPSSDSE